MSTTNWPYTDSEITFTGAYTCTHHNDQQRSACPVCLVAALTTERDQLRAEVERLKKQAVFDADHVHTLNSAFATRAEVTDANARAERAERELETEKNNRNYLIEKGAGLERDLAALEQCHDDNCRGVVKIAEELATERARLDWLIAGGVCLVQHSGGFYAGRLNCQVSRADIDAGMKEDAK